MNLFEISIMSALDLLGYIIISSKLVSDRIEDGNLNKCKWILYILLLSISMGIVGILELGIYNVIIGSIISMILIYLLYKKNIKDTVYLYILSTIILLLIQYAIITLLTSLGVNMDLNFRSGLIAQFTMISIALVIKIYLPINFLYNDMYINNKIIKYLILNIFAILFSILLYRYMDMEGVLKDIIVVATLSMTIIYINFFLMNNGIRNQIEEQKLLTFEKYLPVIDELMSEIRAKQHEFDNHIQALSMIATTSEDYETIMDSMKKYIKDIESFTDTTNLIKLNNKVLAGFLYSKLKKSKEMNIKFLVNIKDFGFKTNLKDYELIEVIGNLIDNGFETGVIDNIVYLELTGEKDMSVIEVKNKHSYLGHDSINKIMKVGYSTKLKHGRGYGLPNMKKIISKYGGRIEVSNQSIRDENFVVFKVLLSGI